MNTKMGPDVTGTWRRSDQLIVKLFFQNGAELWSEPFALAPDYGHYLRGRYNLGEQCYDFTVYRTTNATGCVTEMYGKLYKIDNDNIRWKIHSTDGNCDLGTGYTEDFPFTRTKG